MSPSICWRDYKTQVVLGQLEDGRRFVGRSAVNELEMFFFSLLQSTAVAASDGEAQEKRRIWVCDEIPDRRY